jgi:hypothetical protein
MRQHAFIQAPRRGSNNVPISIRLLPRESCIQHPTNKASAANLRNGLHAQFSSDSKERGLQPFVVKRDNTEQEDRRKLWLGSQAGGETRERASGDGLGAILEWRLVGLYDPVRPDGPVTIRD